MIAFIAENLAPIMFASLVVVMLLGYPVAFSLSAVGLLFFFIGVELAPYSNRTVSLDWPLLGVMPQRIFGVMNNETLLAIPFFTFMGLILERTGMAEDLLDTIGQLFGSMRGGLAFAVIFVGALLAATTGVVAASVISMGLISLPIMLRYGYDRKLATGVIAASGTLAQIIPPSLVLIVMADQLGRSVGDMYKGAFIPGFILTMLYAGWVVLVTIFKKEAAPALPESARTLPEDTSKATRQGVFALIGFSAFSVLLAYFIVWLIMLAAEASGVKTGDLSAQTHLGLAIAGAAALLSLRLTRGQRWKAIASPRMNTGAAIGLAIVCGLVVFKLFRVAYPKMPVDNAVVWSSLIAVTALYGAALINRYARLHVMALITERVVIVLTPPLALIFLVLGTIFIGIATPTEAGAMGAMGALLLSISKRRLTFDLMKQAMDTTAKLSCFVVFILIGARVFSLTFYGVNGQIWVEHLLTSLPGGQMGFLIFVNILVFLLAFFLDFFELAFIIVPLLAPVAHKLGIDLIWFGVILSVNMQTSFMHPPFGFALFYLRSVAPRTSYIDKIKGNSIAPVTTGQIYLGAIPFVFIQVLMVVLVISFPSMVMVYKSGEIKLDKKQIEQQFKNLTPAPALQAPPPLKF
jgi:tripartite ATP-independent transporter DctM subunit